MSRWTSLVLAGTSALALTAAAAPAPAPTSEPTTPTVVAGKGETRVGGSWCC